MQGQLLSLGGMDFTWEGYPKSLCHLLTHGFEVVAVTRLHWRYKSLHKIMTLLGCIRLVARANGTPGAGASVITITMYKHQRPITPELTKASNIQ
jgi:hypothetical protein